MITVVGFLLAAGATTATAAPASADTLVQVTCAGSETTEYSPGLTNTTATVTRTTSQTFHPCLHINGLQITTWTGTNNFQTQTTTSCTELLAGTSSTRVIHWSNGQSSTWEFSNTVQTIEGNTVIIAIGEITDGLYEGALAQRELVLVGLLDALATCDTPEGLTELSGTFTFTITGL